ncbi:hypothetical protein QE392_001709 [Microbacterium proteolyticum]|nr:hypothetical protein [Microbacterium proteolyticum]
MQHRAARERERVVGERAQLCRVEVVEHVVAHDEVELLARREELARTRRDEAPPRPAAFAGGLERAGVGVGAHPFHIEAVARGEAGETDHHVAPAAAEVEHSGGAGESAQLRPHARAVDAPPRRHEPVHRVEPAVGGCQGTRVAVGVVHELGQSRVAPREPVAGASAHAVARRTVIFAASTVSPGPNASAAT